MIRGSDFILNPNKLEEQLQLVEVSDWVDFSTKEKPGFYYTVLFSKLKFEKVKVGVKTSSPLSSRKGTHGRYMIQNPFQPLALI